MITEQFSQHVAHEQCWEYIYDGERGKANTNIKCIETENNKRFPFLLHLQFSSAETVEISFRKSLMYHQEHHLFVDGDF
jgi:hypothetical protein